MPHKAEYVERCRAILPCCSTSHVGYLKPVALRPCPKLSAYRHSHTVIFKRCFVDNGAYNIVGNLTGLSSAVSIIQFLQPWHEDFGLSRALCTHCTMMTLENLKGICFYAKSPLAANPVQ
jgi:hypothetical protein